MVHLPVTCSPLAFTGRGGLSISFHGSQASPICRSWRNTQTQGKPGITSRRPRESEELLAAQGYRLFLGRIPGKQVKQRKPQPQDWTGGQCPPYPFPRWKAVFSTWHQGSGWGVGQAAADHPLSRLFSHLPQLHTVRSSPSYTQLRHRYSPVAGLVISSLGPFKMIFKTGGGC